MREITTNGTIKNGVLSLSYRDRFNQALKMFDDCRVEVIVRKMYKRNSKEQRGYYFGCICSYYVIGAWHTQQRILSINEAHEELKSNCNYKEWVNENTGAIMREILSTETSTALKEEYLEKCRSFILEWFGIHVELPNEQGDLFKTKEDLKEAVKLIQTQ